MGIQSINDIVNEISFKRNNNDNVGRRKAQAEIERADRLADYACEKNWQSRCKGVLLQSGL